MPKRLGLDRSTPMGSFSMQWCSSAIAVSPGRLAFTINLFIQFAKNALTSNRAYTTRDGLRPTMR